jgi:hypothetical protein
MTTDHRVVANQPRAAGVEGVVLMEKASNARLIFASADNGNGVLITCSAGGQEYMPLLQSLTDLI